MTFSMSPNISPSELPQGKARKLPIEQLPGHPRELTALSSLCYNSKFPSLAGKFLMNSSLDKKVKLKRNWRLVRLVAIFFLLHTGADLFLPQYFCSGEMGGLPASSRVLASTGADSNLFTRDVSSRLDNTDEVPSPDREVPHEEDCFCCCAHVLPCTGFVNAVVSDLRSPQLPSAERLVPSPQLRGPYHPPRLS